MKYFAGGIGILPIFPALWVLFAQGMPDVGSAGILSFAATLVIGLLCLFHFWQPGGVLDTTDLKKLGIIVLVLGVIVVLWYVSDAVIAGVNPLDRKQWPLLLGSGGSPGFVMTPIVAVSFTAVMTATIIRALILKVLGSS